MVFKRVEDGRPYPDHGLTPQEWVSIPPSRVRLSTLVTTRRPVDLAALLVDDSTFFGDLFAHVVQWNGELYLEDGMHRALRAALGSRGGALLHARIHVLDPEGVVRTPADHLAARA